MLLLLVPQASVRWPIVERQVHRCDIGVRKHDAVAGQVRFMAMVQEALKIELRVEHIVAVLNNCARTRRCFTAGIHKVYGLAMTLPDGADGSEEKSAFPNRFIV